jgi:hypothetical protein
MSANDPKRTLSTKNNGSPKGPPLYFCFNLHAHFNRSGGTVTVRKKNCTLHQDNAPKILVMIAALVACVILTTASAWSASIHHRIRPVEAPSSSRLNDPPTAEVFAGQRYALDVRIKKDLLNCGVRLGIKVSNPSLVKPSSSSLHVRMSKLEFSHKSGPLQGFGKVPESTCSAKGEFTIKKPPQPIVPVVMTLTYGPSLKKLIHLKVKQKYTVKAITASPKRSNYPKGTRVRFLITTNHFGPVPLEFGISSGRLCNSHGPVSSLNKKTFDTTTGWTPLPVFAKKNRTWIEGDLCDLWKTTIHVRARRNSSGMKSFSVSVNNPKKGRPKRR